MIDFIKLQVLFQKIKQKIRLTLYDFLGSRFVFGYNKRSEAVLNNSYASGFWNYLSDKREAPRYLAILEMLQKMEPNSGLSILDIGCGQGVLYSFLNDKLSGLISHYTGIDISAKAIEMATLTYPGVDFRKLDFDKSRLDEKYDIIVFNEVLYYLQNPLKAINKAVHNNLTEKGCILISMHEYHGRNEPIWKKIEQSYIVLGSEFIKGEAQCWKVQIIKPS